MNDSNFTNTTFPIFCHCDKCTSKRKITVSTEDGRLMLTAEKCTSKHCNPRTADDVISDSIAAINDLKAAGYRVASVLMNKQDYLRLMNRTEPPITFHHHFKLPPTLSIDDVPLFYNEGEDSVAASCYPPSVCKRTRNGR